MNQKLWTQFLKISPSGNFQEYTEWCIKNKSKIENELLKFGKQTAPALKDVIVNKKYDHSYFHVDTATIFMDATLGLPLIDKDGSSRSDDFDDFVSTFIHELHHAVQFSTGPLKGKAKSYSKDYHLYTNSNIHAPATATYDYHTVTPMELEAIANQLFSDSMLSLFGEHDGYDTIHQRYPSWSDFMAALKQHEMDPESVAKILTKNDGSQFKLDHPVEGKALRLFIREYLKVAQNFYYGGIEDDSAIFRKQKDLGLRRKHLKKQQKIEQEFLSHLSQKRNAAKPSEQINTSPQSLRDLLKIKDWPQYINHFIKDELQHSLPQLKHKIESGEDVSGWLHQHLPPSIVSQIHITSVDVKIHLKTFDLPDFQLDDGKMTVVYTTHQKYVSDEVILDILAYMCRESIYANLDKK